MAEPATPRPDDPERPRRSRWPWVVLSLLIVPAVWHVVDFPEDLDPEHPGVDRPTFNRLPPPAYRLAEPGDTLDRVGIYLASAATVIAAINLLRARRDPGLWPAALGLSVASLWQVATPGPTFDGWHGLGWRVLLDPSAPTPTRLAVGAGALGLATLVLGNLWAVRHRGRSLWEAGRAREIRRLVVAAAALIAARQFELPGVEPAGYWPRWAFDAGLLALVLALLQASALAPSSPRAKLVRSGIGLVGGAVLVAGGVWLSWYHRPLERLRTVEPGKIYISAMPTYRGLEAAYARHPFRTIVNLFPEDTSQRSPRLPEELRFVRERGIRYVQASARDNDTDEFLDRTLALARDPSAWPILVHCHGCMDRSPAWMGIYRFVVQGRPLDAIMREIEAHRGYRPKAMITLLFNRVLEPRAPDRYRADPTARLLREGAHGVVVDHLGPSPEVTRAGPVGGRR